MKSFVVWLCLFSVGFCMRETCTRYSLNYQDRTVFTSEKDDGRRYTCTCRYSNCAYISCRLDRTPTTEPEDENEVPRVPYPSVPTDNGNVCYDWSGSTPARYQRGQYFVTKRPSESLVICICPMTGPPTLQCRQPRRQCSLPSSPAVDWDSLRYMRASSCYDAWNARVYTSGQRYTRTRLMNENDTLTGEYDCTCRLRSMRCIARDIPCCDLATGRFVGMNEQFLSLVGGQYRTCTCKRQRGRFSNCQDIDPQFGRPVPTTPISQVCVDGDAVYTVGQRWTERSRNGYHSRRCLCTANGQTSCENWVTNPNPTYNPPENLTSTARFCADGDALYIIGQQFTETSGYYSRSCTCATNGQFECGDWKQTGDRNPTTEPPTTRRCVDGDALYTVGQKLSQTSGYYTRSCTCAANGQFECGDWKPSNQGPRYDRPTQTTGYCVEGDVVYRAGQEWTKSSPDGYYTLRCSCNANGNIECDDSWQPSRTRQ